MQPLPVRRRKAALHVGAVLPHELLAQLVESGELVGLGEDAHLVSVAEESEQELGGGQQVEAAAAKEGPLAETPALPAAAEGNVGSSGSAQEHAKAASSAAAAPAASPGVSAHRSAVTASPSGSPGQAELAAPEPLLAYTSLARQQLQQRLKAAIAAGTRPASGQGAASALRSSLAQASQAGQLAGSRSPWQQQQQAGAGQLGLGLRQPPLLSQGAPQTVSPSLSFLGPSALPLESPFASQAATDALGSSLQLPLPSTSTNGRAAGTAAGAAAVLQSQQTDGWLHPLATPGSPAQAHWIAAQLLRQPVYHAIPRPAGQHQQQQQQAGVQRGLLALRMPPLTSQFAELLPVRVQDASVGPCLLVLPSDGPSSRQEAEAAEAALQQLLEDPPGAAQWAAAWRQQLLLTSSSAALLGLTANYVPFQHAHELRQPESQQVRRQGSLAGPAWLAGASCRGGGCGAGRRRSSPAATQAGMQWAAAGDAVQGVRRSSGFLREGSRASRSRSASPLPMLSVSRPSSRLSGSMVLLPSAVAEAHAGAASWLASSSPSAEAAFLPTGTASPGSSASTCHISAVPGSGDAAGAAGAGAAGPSAVTAAARAVSPQPGAPQAAVAVAAAAAQMSAAWAAAPPPSAADPAWSAYCCASLAAGLAACMAEVVRQVEVGCAERGRLLAQLWNGYTGVLTITIQQQHEQLEASTTANANLAAEMSQLRWEVSSMTFLRAEISRLRKDKETVTLELQDCQQEVAALQEEAKATNEQLEEMEVHLRRRVAVLRWRYAGAAVLAPAAGVRHSQAQHTSEAIPYLEESQRPHKPLVQLTATLERLSVAAAEADLQRQAWRQNRRAQAALAAALSAPAPGARAAAGAGASAGAAGAGGSGGFASLHRAFSRPQSRLQHSNSAAPNPPSSSGGAVGLLDKPPSSQRLASGSSSSSNSYHGSAGAAPTSSLAMLRCLRPEARAALLLGLPSQQRQPLLAAMSDAERAALLLVLDAPARLQVLEDMGPALVSSTEVWIGRKPLLLVRQLAALSPEQAAAHFCSQLTPQQQALVLEAAPPQQAAALLQSRQMEEGQRQRLLQGLPSSSAATLLEWILPAAALQLLLSSYAATPSSAPSAPTAPAAAAAPAWGPGSAASVAGTRDGSASSRVTEVVERLGDRHLNAMLAAAQPGEAALLLGLLPTQERQRLLHLMPPSLKASALAALHQRHAAAVRQHEESAAAAGAAALPAGDSACGLHPAEAQPPVLLPPPERVPPLELGKLPREGLPPLDPGSALLAHFQQLSPAEKTSLLLVGSAPTAALLLPLLGEAEASDVLMLLPQQRQEQLLRLLHPAEERRIQGAAQQASRRRSSLMPLLPQQLGIGAAADGAAGALGSRRSSLLPQQLVAPLAEAAAAGGEIRRRGSLSQFATTAAAAAAGTAEPGRPRGSLLAPQHGGGTSNRRSSVGASSQRRSSVSMPPLLTEQRMP